MARFNPNPAYRKNILAGLQVPANLDPELRKYLAAVKEHIELGHGNKGQPKKRFVTIDELEDLGLIETVIKSNRAEINSASGGTGDNTTTALVTENDWNGGQIDGDIVIANVDPSLEFFETNAAADQRRWNIRVDGAQMQLVALGDAETELGGLPFVTFSRGTTSDRFINSIVFSTDNVDLIEIDNVGLYARQGGRLGLYSVPETEVMEMYFSGTDVLFDGTGVTNFDFGAPATSTVWRFQGDVHVREASLLRAYDSTNTDYIELSETGTAARIATNTNPIEILPASGSYAAIITGRSFRIYDSTDTDYAEFLHDGVDFNTVFNGTRRWDIEFTAGNNVVLPTMTGAGDMGVSVETTNTAAASYIDAYNDQTGQYIELSAYGATYGAGGIPHTLYFSSSVADFRITGDVADYVIFTDPTGTTTEVGIVDGTSFVIYDSSNADTATFSHDGVDFNTVFTGTTQWDISGADVRVNDTLYVGSGDTASGDVLLFFDADREWAFQAFGVDANTSLDLVSQAGNKNFNIRDSADTIQFSFLLTSTQDPTFRIFDITGADAARFSHDGVDFNTTFTNTTAWNITVGTLSVVGKIENDQGVALGAGSSATLGTIGGSGPATAAQAQWLEVDISGTAHWIPVWT